MGLRSWEEEAPPPGRAGRQNEPRTWISQLQTPLHGGAPLSLGVYAAHSHRHAVQTPVGQPPPPVSGWPGGSVLWLDRMSKGSGLAGPLGCLVPGKRVLGALTAGVGDRGEVQSGACCLCRGG